MCPAPKQKAVGAQKPSVKKKSADGDVRDESEDEGEADSSDDEDSSAMQKKPKSGQKAPVLPGRKMGKGHAKEHHAKGPPREGAPHEHHAQQEPHAEERPSGKSKHGNGGTTNKNGNGGDEQHKKEDNHQQSGRNKQEKHHSEKRTGGEKHHEDKKKAALSHLEEHDEELAERDEDLEEHDKAKKKHHGQQQHHRSHLKQQKERQRGPKKEHVVRDGHLGEKHKEHQHPHIKNAHRGRQHGGQHDSHNDGKNPDSHNAAPAPGSSPSKNHQRPTHQEQHRPSGENDEHESDEIHSLPEHSEKEHEKVKHDVKNHPAHAPKKQHKPHKTSHHKEPQNGWKGDKVPTVPPADDKSGAPPGNPHGGPPPHRQQEVDHVSKKNFRNDGRRKSVHDEMNMKRHSRQAPAGEHQHDVHDGDHPRPGKKPSRQHPPTSHRESETEVEEKDFKDNPGKKAVWRPRDEQPSDSTGDAAHQHSDGRRAPAEKIEKNIHQQNEDDIDKKTALEEKTDAQLRAEQQVSTAWKSFRDAFGQPAQDDVAEQLRIEQQLETERRTVKQLEGWHDDHYREAEAIVNGKHPLGGTAYLQLKERKANPEIAVAHMFPPAKKVEDVRVAMRPDPAPGARGAAGAGTKKPAGKTTEKLQQPAGKTIMDEGKAIMDAASAVEGNIALKKRFSNLRRDEFELMPDDEWGSATDSFMQTSTENGASETGKDHLRQRCAVEMFVWIRFLLAFIWDLGGRAFWGGGIFRRRASNRADV